MKTLALACNHCGAPLEVPAKTRFLTCTFCSSQLEVHRSGGAAYTEVLEALKERTEQVADEVETLELKLDLEKLDREWTEKWKDYVTEASSPITTVFLALFMVGSGILMLMVGIGFGAAGDSVTGLAMAFPSALFFFFLGYYVYVVGSEKAEAYTQAKQKYDERREDLLQRIEASSERANEAEIEESDQQEDHRPE